MQLPSTEQVSRIFELIEEFDQLPNSDLHDAIASLYHCQSTEDIRSYVRLNYQLPPPPQYEFEPGERIACHYTIKEKIGTGGMGIVYRAQQDYTQRDVALKFIHPRLQTREIADRFSLEIINLAKLNHPGIVQIFDATEHDHQTFFVMQLVDGFSLNHAIAKRKLTNKQKIRIMIQLCLAIHEAHKNGITHRDLKPSNIVINKHTGNPVILDFGLASVVTDPPHRRSGWSGTLNYMSPEQFEDQHYQAHVSHRSDLYSLGVIAFELFSNRSPYDFPVACSDAEKRHIIITSSPRQLTEMPHLNHILQTALDKNPAARFHTAIEFASSLAALPHS